MHNVVPFLLSLLSKPGLTGFEESVSEVIAERWHPLVDELSVSPLRSLHGLRRSISTTKSPSLMIAAHMDAIGLMVKQIEGGMAWVTPLGGIDPRILPGQLVTLHGSKEIPGLVQVVPDRLINGQDASKAPSFERLFIDTGLSEKELSQLVKPGCLASFAQPPFELSGGYVAGHSLDNRASVAALTVCLDEIRNYNLAWNLVAVATSQEEFRQAGAYTSTFGIRPDLAVILDVTFAKGPGANDYRCFPLGGGLTIGVGANNHPSLVKKFTSLAEELDMPFDMEAMPVSSGTEGMAAQVTANGVPVIVISIPIRYMHTSVEMAGLNDIQRAGRLLARFVTSLEADSMSNLFEEVNL